MATSAVLFSGSIEDWFRTKGGIRQGCLLSETLFHIILEKDHGTRLRRSWRQCQHLRQNRHCQHFRQSNHQSPLYWWHRWLSRRGRMEKLVERLYKASSLWQGDQCREDQADDKQHQRHQQRDPSKWTEAWDSHKLQVPGLSCIWGSQQGWKQFETTGAFISVPRYAWCAFLSHPFSCMLVNHGPSHQSWKEEYEP